MKTNLIAGKPLEPQYHNVISDDMRDGLKSKSMSYPGGPGYDDEMGNQQAR